MQRKAQAADVACRLLAGGIEAQPCLPRARVPQPTRSPPSGTSTDCRHEQLYLQLHCMPKCTCISTHLPAAPPPTAPSGPG